MLPRLIRSLLCLAAATPCLLPAQWTTDSATRYLDSVYAVVKRSHWDTTAVGDRYTTVWRSERDALTQGAPSLDRTRDASARLLRSLQQSHFGIIPGTTQLDVDAPAAGGYTVPITVRLIRDTLCVVRLDGSADGFATGQQVVTIDEASVEAERQRLAPLDRRERALRLHQWAAARLSGDSASTLLVRVRTPSGDMRVLHAARTMRRGVPLSMGGFGLVMARAEGRIVTRGTRQVGVIAFDVWVPQLLPRIDSLIDQYRSLDGLVFDVRGNPGGLAVMANGLAGHVLDDTIMLARMALRSGALTFRSNPRRLSRTGARVQPFTGPVAVLVDGESASTSELFAGGLQAVGRAIIVGDTTAGMALPSLTFRLPGGDRLQYAVASLTTARGASLEGRGVIPDRVRPWSSLPVAGDPQLALALDAIVPRSFPSAPLRRRAARR